MLNNLCFAVRQQIPILMKCCSLELIESFLLYSYMETVAICLRGEIWAFETSLSPLYFIDQARKVSVYGYNDIVTYIQDQNIIHGYILILNFFQLIWKIYNSIGRNLILKYCPRIIFYIKNNPLERILWRIK